MNRKRSHIRYCITASKNAMIDLFKWKLNLCSQPIAVVVLEPPVGRQERTVAEAEMPLSCQFSFYKSSTFLFCCPCQNSSANLLSTKALCFFSSSSDSTNSMGRVSRRKKKISEGFHIGWKSVRFHWGDYSLVETDVDWISGDTDLVIQIWWYGSGDRDLVLQIW